MVNRNKGSAFITVVIVSTLMIFVTVAISNMILNDTRMIMHMRYSTQALYLAEAGVSDAFAVLVTDGFSAKDTASKFPKTDLGAGYYDVSVIEFEERVLLSSEGVVEGVSRIVTVEVEDISSPVLKNSLSAGTNIVLKSNKGSITISGDIHANNDLKLQEIGDPTVLSISADPGGATGKATCCGKYTISGNVSIADEANSGDGRPKLSMPVFDFSTFKTEAVAGGNYISSTATLTGSISGGPSGITYVNGDVTFEGACSIVGGFVAKGKITLNPNNSLVQTQDAGNRFPIFMSETGSRIKLFGDFTTNQGNIVYATNDIQIETPGTGSTVTGAVIAGGSFIITANKPLTITYTEITAAEVVPEILRVVSWNR